MLCNTEQNSIDLVCRVGRKWRPRFQLAVVKVSTCASRLGVERPHEAQRSGNAHQPQYGWAWRETYTWWQPHEGTEHFCMRYKCPWLLETRQKPAAKVSSIVLSSNRAVRSVCARSGKDSADCGFPSHLRRRGESLGEFISARRTQETGTCWCTRVS